MARYATIERAAKEHGLSYYTIRKYIKEDRFPVYRLHGVQAACVDLDEVEAAFRLDPPRGVRGYSEFEGGTVRDLRKVAIDPAAVLR